MRDFANKKTTPAGAEGGTSASKDDSGSWFSKNWRLVCLFAIVLVAFLIRFVFAYGISAGDNYALSGSSASSHLRVIMEIMAGTYDPANQAMVNYPYGAFSTSGPAFDYLMAGIASIVSATGISNATAAAGTLAWSAPILGALTCIPVYLLAKRMFKGDETIAVVSALFYALFAVLIMTTPFSNGTEFPFVGFLIAVLVYLLTVIYDRADKAGLVGFQGVKDKSVLIPVIVAGLIFGVIVLSWTEFRILVIAAAAMMLVALVLQRIGGRDMAFTVVVSNLIVVIGIAIGAVYYLVAGLWDDVFSGGCLIAVLALVYSFAFLAVEKKPWVITIPVFAIIIIAVAAVIAVAMPELSAAMLDGNSAYIGSLMASLGNTTTLVRISTMASYYGWLTMWFPLLVGVWMLYKYRSHSKSRLYVFTMLWTFAMFFMSWFSTAYAYVTGTVFAVSAGYLLVTVIREVNVRSYFKSLRGNGFSAGAKKALNFFPLATVLVVVFLVAAPTAVYAVGAAVPNNDSPIDYFDGYGYNINTSDSNLISSAWDSYANKDKDGALVTWYGYSDSATTVGGFNSVTSVNGGGTAAMSSTLLSTGSSGAIASFIVRLVEGSPANFTKTFSDVIGNDEAGKLVKLFDVDNAKAYIFENPADFSGLKKELSDDTAIYHAAVAYMQKNLSSSKITELYNAVCKESGNKIGYVEVDTSFLPTYTNSSSYLSTLGYFGDYSINEYGIVTEFCTWNALSNYYMQNYGYAPIYYSDAMYETFLWNALIGITPADTGSSNSLELIQALALSDGTVKAIPGYGLENFKVAYWHVMYNPASDATNSSEGWVDMDGFEAISKQNAEGGMINYFASLVVLEYDGTTSAPVTSYSGTVIDTDGKPIKGIKVVAYEKAGYDTSGATGYVPRSTVYTDAEGKFTISVTASNSKEVLVKYFAGSVALRDGFAIATTEDLSNLDLVLDSSSFAGTVFVTDDTVFESTFGTINLVATGVASGNVYKANVESDGSFTFGKMIPDIYSVAVQSQDYSALTTVTVDVTAGDVTNAHISAAGATITVRLTDIYNNSSFVNDNTYIQVVESTGLYKVTIKADTVTKTVKVPATSTNQTYYVYVDGDYTSINYGTASVKSGGSASVSISVVENNHNDVLGGAQYMNLALTLSSSENGINAPFTGKLFSEIGDLASSMPFTKYFLSYENGSYKVNGDAAYTVSGKLSTGKAGTVAFVNGEKQYVFTAANDGAYKAIIPAGTYVLYAFDTTGKVALTFDYKVSADKTEDIVLEEGATFTASMKYQNRTSSSSTQGLGYIGVSAVLDNNGKSVTLYGATVSTSSTSTNGIATFYAPKGYDVTLTSLVKSDENSVFAFKEAFTKVFKSDVESKSVVWTINYTAADDKNASVNPIDIEVYAGDELLTGTYKDAFVASASSATKYTVEDGKIVNMIPGRYNVTISDDTHYFNGSVTVYPNSTKVTLDIVEIFKVSITKDSANELECIAIPNENGDEGEIDYDSASPSVKENVYYLQTGFSYYFVLSPIVTTESDDKDDESDVFEYHKAYFSPVVSEATTIDFTKATIRDTAVISGYLGSKCEGTIIAQFEGAEVYATVEDGEYSMEVCAGVSITLVAKATSTVGNKTFVQSFADKVINALDAKAKVTVNFSADDSEEKNKDFAIVDVTSAKFKEGVAEMKLTVTNNGKFAETFKVTGTSALILDQLYVVNIAAGKTATIDIKGHYNSNTIGEGNENLYLNIETFSGSKYGKAIMPAGSFEVDASKTLDISVSGMEGASADAINGYAYKYAVTFDNKASSAAMVTIDAITVLDNGWTAYLCDSTGSNIKALGSTYTVNGLAKDTIYVMVLNDNKETKNVPDMSFTVTPAGGCNGIKAAEESSVIVVQDNVAKITLKAYDMDLEVEDASVSGNNTDNEKKEVSMAFWALAILSVLGLLVFIWAGLKRGVFSRKN
ncbi:MAG: hypothetical protein MJZ68_00165 [archaeon]|nr:hypothetical protein [archaeon]